MNKYNLNDEVFTMNNNVVCKFQIKAISMVETIKEGDLIYYQDLFGDIRREERFCFKTKEELLASL